MKKSVKRLCFSRVPLEGFYKYKDEFYIYPWNKEPKVPWTRADHPIIIEISVDDLEIIDPEKEWLEIGEYADKKSLEIKTLLSTFSNYRFYTYHVDNAWFLPYINETFQKPSVYGQLTYHPDANLNDLSYNEFNEVKLIEDREYFTQYAARLGTQPVTFPSSLSSLLDIFYSFDEEKKNYFNSAITLYLNGLEFKDYYLTFSLAIIAFVSALETIISYESKGESQTFCSKCGRPIFSVRQKFLDFYEKTSGRKENRKFADYLYSLRSGISHGGRLFTSDKIPGFELMDSVQLENIIKNIRMCIVNWLILNKITRAEHA